MKSLPALVIAASVGTCSIGGQQRLPPSPAEQEAAANKSTTSTTHTGSDPWAGLPEECRELNAPCEECDEVERMRRKIEFKKCVPVCDAYLDRTEELAEVPQEAVTLLQGRNACGKVETTCSPIEQSRCEYVIGYVTVGELFRATWRDHGDGLARKLHAEFVAPYLDHHGRVITWAQSNELDPAPLLVVGGDLLALTHTEMINEVSAELAGREDPDLPAVAALVELARFPGDPATFAKRRGEAEAPLRR